MSASPLRIMTASLMMILAACIGTASAQDAAIPPANTGQGAEEPGKAAGEDAAKPVPPPPLRLDPGGSIEISCDTQAVLVATGAANATSGRIHLRLERTADPTHDGQWTPLDDGATHAASLAVMQAKACATGCPLMIGKNDDLQLWAPAAKSLDKLGADELLLLAVIKSATWQLKASTFRGQQIEALESGVCTRSSPAATPP
ncbi:MAG: hypothetical protein KDJ18_10885 [Hyphomicrobiaceae bacterium]|nr:hypothetical protein [Hyphomicrobiaceae bacterium]